MSISKKFKKIKSIFGPGFITGASDDDPSGIATYAQTGAQFGFHQAWLSLFSFPFMSVVQEMCGRIGIVTGHGLSGVIREHYSKKILYPAVILLLFANTINIGANLGAMASSIQLLINIPFIVPLLVITFVTLYLEVTVSYKNYAKFLKYLALSLLSYIVVAFMINLNWNEVTKSLLIPTFIFDRGYMINIVAILGTTISPYLFFWQANEEVDEEIEKRKVRMMGKGLSRMKRLTIHDMRIDTVIGMFFSNTVMFFIIVATASTLAKAGIHDIQTADQAALALRPLAGNLAFLLFTLGIIGTGMLSVPVLAGSASYAISEAVGWKAGLGRKFKQAINFYLVIIVATLIGLFINVLPIAPFKMLYYTAVINGLIAPPLMVIIMLISRNKKIMGNYTNSTFSNLFGWIITVVMAAASLGLFIEFAFL